MPRQWAVQQSTAHRLEIRRALYLMSSNNKFACPPNAHLRPVNCAFSDFASLKLNLFIQPPARENSSGEIVVVTAISLVFLLHNIPEVKHPHPPPKNGLDQKLKGSFRNAGIKNHTRALVAVCVV